MLIKWVFFMKNFLFILFFIFSGYCYAQIEVQQTEQTQTVHQYIVHQAYEYL